jgi:hypothetical protein
MGETYPYMDLNAKYEKLYYDDLLLLIQIRISPKWGKCFKKKQKKTERTFNPQSAFAPSKGYESVPFNVWEQRPEWFTTSVSTGVTKDQKTSRDIDGPICYLPLLKIGQIHFQIISL